MTVNLSALAGAGQQFFDNNGNPLSGGKLYSYEAGTTTPQTTYTSANGLTAHTNPIVLDSAGRVATGEIWLTAGQNYKFVLKTSTETTLATWDNITGINGTGITSNADNVEYDPPFTGALTSGYTVEDKLAQTVSVKDFGAVGDGATNDTAAFVLALDASDSVYVPEGTYLVDTVKFLQRGGTSLIGQSKITTVLKASASSTKLLDISGTVSNYIIENTVENMTLDMSSMVNVNTSYGLYMARSYNNSFNNVNVIGFGTNKRSISLQCLPGVFSGGGVFTTQFTNCDFGSIAGTIELKGNSPSDAITTVTFLDTRFAQARIDGAVSINFIQATVQGPLDKFVISNAFGVSISGSDIEGTGVYLVNGALNQHFYSYANQFVGFTGTYMTGTVGDRSYINDPVVQDVQFIGHSVVLSNGKFQAVSGLGTGLRHLSEVTGTPTQNDWEFKTTNGSVFIGQEATGTASIDNRAGGDILLRDNGTTRFGYLKSSNRLTVGSATAASAGAVAGYIEVVISGVTYKIPYHANS